MVIELPLNLQVIAPAHQPNWDLVSDLVSSNYSRLYRSPAECKKRFETIILKREELCLTELQNKKQQQLQLQQQQQQANQKTKQPAKASVILNSLFKLMGFFKCLFKCFFKAAEHLQDKNTSHQSVVHSGQLQEPVGHGEEALWKNNLNCQEAASDHVQLRACCKAQSGAQPYFEYYDQPGAFTGFQCRHKLTAAAASIPTAAAVAAFRLVLIEV